MSANERAERLLVSVSELGEDLLLCVFDRDGPRSNHGLTVPRNARASRVSTLGMTRSIRDDDDLLFACAKGDEQALGSLYDRFGKVAYGLALRVLRDAGLAEDAVQEAFLDVWRRAASFDRSRGAPSTWILTIVHRRAVDLVRSQAHFNALPDQIEATAAQAILAESVDDDVALLEARGKIRAALAKLSRAEREVLCLAYWFGLTQSQIASALGIPSGTVKSRTFNALARLRKALSQMPDLRPATRRGSIVTHARKSAPAYVSG